MAVELRSTGQPRRLSPHLLLEKNWGGKRESNPQPSEPQSGALPVELFPPQLSHYSNWTSLGNRKAEGRLEISDIRCQISSDYSDGLGAAI